MMQQNAGTKTDHGSINLSTFRTLRVLRPLKSINNIESLKLIMSAILRSLPILKDAIYINIFFLFTFAICGL